MRSPVSRCLLLFFLLATTAGCRFTFVHGMQYAQVDGELPVIPSSYSADEYEVVGVLASEGFIEAFDVLGLFSDGETRTSEATAMAIRSGLMEQARKLNGDALTDVRVLNFEASRGCLGEYGPLVPFAISRVQVAATVLKRRTQAAAVPPAAPVTQAAVGQPE